MKKLLVIALWWFAFSISAIGQQRTVASAAQAKGFGNTVPSQVANPPAVPEAYTIGENDLIAIQVWKEPELSRVLPVQPDGNVVLPLIGEVQASGRTAKQLQSYIRDQLNNFMESPEVTVMVQQARSKRFNVIGKVRWPGSFPLTRPTTVLDAIALVGWFRDFAKVKQICVLRPLPGGEYQRLQFNYKQMIREKPAQNIQLEPNDTVVVP